MKTKQRYTTATATVTLQVKKPTVTFGGSPQMPFSRDSNGNYVALVTITNNGNVTVNSAQVTTAGTDPRLRITTFDSASNNESGPRSEYDNHIEVSIERCAVNCNICTIESERHILSRHPQRQLDLSFRSVTLR